MSPGVLGDRIYREDWEEERAHGGEEKACGERKRCWWLLGFQGNLNERECVFLSII